MDRAQILIVDDLPDKRLVLETILQDLGENIVSASSGEDALRQVLLHDFAVILLDVNMPGMDGLETAAYIRRRKKSALTPIIFVTAYMDEIHTTRGYSLGAVDYIFSPVVPEVLRSKVKVFTDLFRMTQQVRRQADERVALAREQAARATAEEASRRFEFLAEAGTALASTLENAAILRTLVRHVVPMLGDLALVSQTDNDGKLVVADIAQGECDHVTHLATIEHSRLGPLHEAIHRCWDSGQSIHLLDAGPWPKLMPVGPNPAAADKGSPNGVRFSPSELDTLRSVVLVPLVARARTLGVLTLVMGPSRRTHTKADMALAWDLAARAGTALDNARLYRNIQQEDERKNQFLAMLAHELRNPLAPIRNAVEVLKLVGIRDVMVVQSRDMIDRQVTHMARLIDDLLDMSRLACGKILLRRKRFDLTRVIRDTLDDYQSVLKRSGLTLETRLPAQPVYVDGEATRLAQVLGNLLHNACKFTDDGGHVTVQLEIVGSDEIMLTVRDTGIGMERDMLGRVFDVFSQADSSLDRSRGGLGLGLALVRGLVELHGGSVRAHSAGLGRGTEITVRLPLAEAADSVETPHPPPTQALRRVLVIEDNPDTAESMQTLLSLCGHDVTIATSGFEGLKSARVTRPEVVLCDIGLPGGMDGYAVARAFRGDPALATIRLIAVSGYGLEEDRRRSQQAGFDTHVIKPVSFRDLQQLLNRDASLQHGQTPAQ